MQATFGTAQKKIKKFREEAYNEVIQIQKYQRIQEEKLREQEVEHSQRSRGKDGAKSGGLAHDRMSGLTGGGRSDLKAWNTSHSKMRVDLEALTFREGGHFNSSTEWKLRRGSKYFNKKGYQEIYVPHISTPPKQIEKRAITSLPKWAQKAFWYHKDDEDGDSDADSNADSDGDETMKESTSKSKGNSAGKSSPKRKFAVTHLNAIQSQCYEAALLSSCNLLLSAPTGAGKTNVAMLCILRELGVHLNADQESVRAEEFKIVYIAPMKSLVREVVLKFSKRLAPFGVRVAELSGDEQLSREQIASTTVIVTTPEKWDIVTRKGMDRSYAQLVRLIIFDEIHLLHDVRGAVLECIIARTLRNIERREQLVRLVGLSATMPNYRDIADLLRVHHGRGLFVFNGSFRPIPLVSRFAGITVKKPLKQYQLMNELCYQYVAEQMVNGQQVIVFVHSRKETANTAKMLLERFKNEDKLQLILPEDGEDGEILRQEAANEDGDIESADLCDLLRFGFGIHNAGMTRSDRMLVEDLFGARVLKVLVSTATLAWGVNMPAHCVIIKGTQIYNAAAGKWTELSMLDILQMFGRAGRPDTGDEYGEATLITTHQELKYYMPLLNEQLPIESQLVAKLADALNAEIVLGAISNIRDAAEWLTYSYLNIRMLAAPKTYHIEIDEASSSSESARAAIERAVKQRRIDLAHSGLLKLAKCGLIVYDSRTGLVSSTDVGRVASFYYISYRTMEEYAECLSSPIMNDIDLFAMFSVSAEFKYLSVREGERQELLQLLDKVPIPIKESIDHPQCKINVLLQAYISRLKLDGFALKSDMVYVQQSAARLMRAIFEIALKRKWANVAYRCLTICKMIAHKQWSIESPLRQFGLNSHRNKLTHSIIWRMEKCQFSFDQFLYLSAAEIGELIRMPAVGRDIHRLIHQIPRLQLKGQIQPLTPSMIRIELQIEADFEWNEFYHGESQQFWIMVEDVDGEAILHAEYFVLHRKLHGDVHSVSFCIPIYGDCSDSGGASTTSHSLPPQYFVRIVSDEWLGSTTILPISFRHLILPQKYRQKTELLDLQPLPTAQYPEIWTFGGRHISYFNAIQTQIFNNLYHSDHNVLLCGPSSCGKTKSAEIAIIKMLQQYPNGKCVYMTPREELAAKQYAEWTTGFGGDRGVTVCRLNGEDLNDDLKRIGRGQVIVTTPAAYDRVQRGWRKRKVLQNINLMIFDDLHFVGVSTATMDGSGYEVVVSRQKLIISALEVPTRIVGLSLSISNAKDIADWLGVGSKFLYNFSPKIRPIGYTVTVKASDIVNFESRHIWYIKQCWSHIEGQLDVVDRHTDRQQHIGGGVMVFVPSRKHCKRLAADIVALSKMHKVALLNLEEADFRKYLDAKKAVIGSGGLYQCLKHGVGFIDEHQSEATRRSVVAFYKSAAIKVLVAVHTECYDLERLGLKDGAKEMTASVVVFGTKYHCGMRHHLVDYEVCDVVQMMSFINCRSTGGDSSHNNALILCHENREWFWKRFLSDSFAMESHLDTENHLEDALNAEIVSGTVSTADDAIDFMTWTLYYFRLTQNPNYYNLRGVEDADLSQHLSALIEEALHRLLNAQCISVDEGMRVKPCNNGLIASHYGITYTTMEFFHSAICKMRGSAASGAGPATVRLKNILSILSYGTEFEWRIAVRKKEEKTISKIARHLPIAIAVGGASSSSDGSALSVANKVNVLLQTHFMRLPLDSAWNADIKRDRDVVLSQCVKLLYAMIDILGTLEMLNGVLVAMELTQMVVQAMWLKDSYLLQLPAITEQGAATLTKKYGVENIYDVLDMEHQERMAALKAAGVGSGEMNAVAMAANQYPDLELNHEIVVNKEGAATLFVTVEAEGEDDDDDEDEDVSGTANAVDKSKVKCAVPGVICPFYPFQKYQAWFLILGDEKKKKLLFIKRFTMSALLKKFKIPLEAKEGKLKLYLMSDSYLGCDQFADIDLDGVNRK